MKVHADRIPMLNGILKNELTAINQYFLHARMFKNWGFEALNAYEYKQSIRVMREADRLIERILFLEGLPNLQSLGALNIGENVQECLNSDMNYEITFARQHLLSGIAEAEQFGDYVTRDLLENLLAASEQSIDWYETQFTLISEIGLSNYLQSQIYYD